MDYFDEFICQFCSGSGEGLTSDSICQFCKGKGIIENEIEEYTREDWLCDQADAKRKYGRDA